MNMALDTNEGLSPLMADETEQPILTSQVFGVVIAAFSTLRLLLGVAKKLASPSLRDLVVLNALLQRLESTIKTTRKELAVQIEEALDGEESMDWGSVKVNRSQDRVKIVANADAAHSACLEAGLDPQTCGLLATNTTFEVVPEVLDTLVSEGRLTQTQRATILREKTLRGKLTCTLSKASKQQVDQILTP